MANFVNDFLEYAEDLESPTCFIEWSSFAAISAILRDNVYLDKGASKIYPNIYVLLVADSSISRKGAPLNLVEGLIGEIRNTKVISGRWSIQGAMRKLQRAENINGTMIKGASAIIYAEELASSVVEDPATPKILTDWYDFHEQWDNTLVSGEFSLSNVCITMLAASNEDYLSDVYTRQAVSGGLLARTFIIRGYGRRRKNSRQYVDLDKYKKRKPRLLEHLKRISKYKGTVQSDEDAKKEFHDWYESLDDNFYQSKSGVEARLHTGVEKLSVILAAAESTFDGLIRKHHVEEAIERSMNLLKNYRNLAIGGGKSQSAQAQNLVL